MNPEKETARKLKAEEHGKEKKGSCKWRDFFVAVASCESP